MASSNAMLSGPSRFAQTTVTAATCTVTVAKPKAGQCVFLVGFILSASAAPGAAQELTITGLYDGTLRQEIPAAAFAPIGYGFGTHYLPCNQGVDMVVSVPSFGAGVIVTLTVFYTYGDV